MSKRQLLAIDVDDVLAATLEAVHTWANEETGAELTAQDYHTGDTYWEYYNTIWKRHGLSDQLNFEQFLTAMETDQSYIPVVEGARAALNKLRANYSLVCITSRPSSQQTASRAWLDEHIGEDVPLYIAYNPKTNSDARSKGEICAELGVSVLIDDNPSNCQSALDYGIDAILFGERGWSDGAPAHIPRARTWADVEERLLGERA